LAHGLADVKMHGLDQDEARQHRGIGEVEAESVALMIGAAHGMDTSGYSLPYVTGWAAQVDGKAPVEIVQATGERVRKTAAEILDQLDSAQVADGTARGVERGMVKPSADQQGSARQTAAPSTASVSPVREPDRGL